MKLKSSLHNVILPSLSFLRISWFQFSGGDYLLEDFTVLENNNGSYVHEPWERVEPKAMIDIVDALANCEFDANGVVPEIVKAWETFFVHLSEAARLYPVQSFICRGLTPPLHAPFNDLQTHEDEYIRLLDCEGGAKVTVQDDVYCLVKSASSVDFNIELQTPTFF